MGAACYGIVRRRDGRILVIQDNDKRPPHYWKLIGGRAEPGESPKAAVERETPEESSLRVKARPQPIYVKTLKGRDGPYDFVVFLMEPVLDDDIQVIPGKEIKTWKWVSPAEIEEMMKNGEFVPYRGDPREISYHADALGVYLYQILPNENDTQSA